MGGIGHQYRSTPQSSILRTVWGKNRVRREQTNPIVLHVDQTTALLLILVCLFCLLWHLEYLVSQLATPCKPWEDQATTSHSSIYWHLIWNWWIFGGNLKASMLRKPSCICYRTNARKHSGFVWIALSLSSSYSYCVCINTETVMRRKTVLGEYGKDVKNPALVFLDSVLICEASLTAHILTYSPRSKKHISVSGPEKQLNVVHLKWVSS